jgi:lanosterol synthase
MSYLSSRQFSIPSNPLLDQLRDEIYAEPQYSINYSLCRNMVLPGDGHQGKSLLLRGFNWVLVNIWNPFLRMPSISKNAENLVYHLMKLEDKATNFTNLGPIDKSLIWISYFAHEGRHSRDVMRHQEMFHEYLWMGSDGMLAMSYNGAQTWETAHMLQAMIQAGLTDKAEFEGVITKAHEFLASQQFLDEWPDQDHSFRSTRLGAFPFSTKIMGYSVSDCTGEVLKAVLLVQSIPRSPKLVSSHRLRMAVDNLLAIQNRSGGYSAWEPNRGSTLLETMNGTELFAKCMVEYDYTECTTSSITALALFGSLDPEYRAEEVRRSISRGIQFIHRAQEKEGGWLGSWGICFSYGTMFAMESLALAGETYENSPSVKRACHFLLGKQNLDGGWGESFKVTVSIVLIEDGGGLTITVGRDGYLYAS